MNIFENNRIKRTANKIECIKEECSKQRMNELRMPLERLALTLKTNRYEFTKKKYEMVNNCLNTILDHLTPSFLIADKMQCQKAIDIINNKCVTTSKNQSIIMDDEIKIQNLENQLRSSKEELNNITNQMDQVLGADEITWKRLNSQKKFLIQNLVASSKVFDSMLTHCSNLKIAESITALKTQYSEVISNQQSLVDADKILESIDTNEYINDSVHNQENLISNRLYEREGSQEDEYQKALREKFTDGKTINNVLSESNKDDLRAI